MARVFFFLVSLKSGGKRGGGGRWWQDIGVGGKWPICPPLAPPLGIRRDDKCHQVCLLQRAAFHIVCLQDSLNPSSLIPRYDRLNNNKVSLPFHERKL